MCVSIYCSAGIKQGMIDKVCQDDRNAGLNGYGCNLLEYPKISPKNSIMVGELEILASFC